MKRRSDEEISAPLYEYDAAVRSQYGCFAGVDEAGRGPLVGNVVVACVVMPKEPLILWVDDSKKLSEKRRESVYAEIMERALYVGIIGVERRRDLLVCPALHSSPSSAKSAISSRWGGRSREMRPHLQARNSSTSMIAQRSVSTSPPRTSRPRLRPMASISS